jgi:methionyl-tRNA formyltransferase
MKSEKTIRLERSIKSTKIVFMGSPDFAVPTLQALDERFALVGVVTQPDRPAGRGRKLTPPPVKVLAQELGIPTIQPISIRKDPSAKDQIQAWQPDVIVVAAFGQILKSDVLNMAPFGCVNVHASLLPRWRGVTPIQAAILNGDAETGITIMKMDEGVDTGPIISQRAIPIESHDTGGSVFEKLAKLGAELLIDTLPKYLVGELKPQPQPAASPTAYAAMLNRSDGELDFYQPAAYLARQVRAYNPWPGTYFQWSGAPLKVHTAHPEVEASPGVGRLTIYENFPAIGTSDGILVLDQLQPAGKKSMPGDVFLRGAKEWE